jgi:hypothetical protein
MTFVSGTVNRRSTPSGFSLLNFSEPRGSVTGIVQSILPPGRACPAFLLKAGGSDVHWLDSGIAACSFF